MTAVDRARIDPRIRQRRIDVARESGRRRLRRVLVLAALTVALLAAVAVALSPLVDVDRIRVRGAGVTAPEAIVAASAIEIGDPMLRLDVDAAAERIAALAWIDSVEVRRDFPASVEIVVTERRPVAIVGADDGALLVDGDGRVLGALEARFADLPRLTASALGEPGAVVADDVRALLPLAASVGAALDGRSVTVGGDVDDVELVLADEVIARVGPVTDVEAKLRALSTVLDQVDLTCVETIDVRVPERPVLTRDEPCQ